MTGRSFEWRYTVSWEWRQADGTVWTPNPPQFTFQTVGHARTKWQRVHDDPYGEGQVSDVAAVATLHAIFAEVRDVSDPARPGRWRPSSHFVSPRPTTDMFDHRPRDADGNLT